MLRYVYYKEYQEIVERKTECRLHRIVQRQGCDTAVRRYMSKYFMPLMSFYEDDMSILCQFP